MADGMRTRVVETLCHDCVIRILWFYGDDDPRFNYVDVQLISSHSEWWHLRWRNRLRNAWAVLRGRYDWSGFQLETPQHAAAFHSALDEAISQTWGSATGRVTGSG